MLPLSARKPDEYIHQPTAPPGKQEPGTASNKVSFCLIGLFFFPCGLVSYYFI